jgi:glycosyltransferase involved in cell wall biosynthesis
MTVKILFIITDTRIGGTERSLLNLLTKLDLHRFTPYVIYLKPGGQYQKFFDQASCVTFKSSSKNCFSTQFLHDVNRFVNDNKITIIHSFLFHANMLARMIKLLNKNVICINSHRTIEKRSIWHLFFDRITKKLANYEVANAEAIKKYYIKHTRSDPSKISTIYNGYDFTDEIQSNPSPQFFFGCVASFSEAKGHSNLIKNLRTFLIHKQYTIAFVGDGHLRKYCQKLTKKYHLENKIFFIDSIFSTQKIFSMFNCLIIPSLWEGMPNVLFEALINEKPVIATNVGGIPEVMQYGRGVYLFDYADPSSLEKHMDHIFNYFNDTKNLAHRMRENISKIFTTTSMIEQYQNLYLCSIQETENGKKTIP